MATKTATVRARVSPSVKKEAEKVLARIGLSSSEAINVFYTRIAKEKAFPFSLHVPNATTRRAIADARAGKVREFKNLEEFAAFVRSA